MFGLLNLDKPAGISSRDAVNRVQRPVKPLKVGHAGTLDPLATGVLVVGIGQATRLVEYVQRMPKTYRATFLLGRTSDTEDIEGQITELPAAPVPSEGELRAAVPQFLGTIQQTPPAFSAVKVGGKRAYALARRGQPPELAARPVEIHGIDVLEYAYPQLVLRIRCGSGTYVRSLGRDLARAVGTDAVMSALQREAIGPFRIEDAIDPEWLSLEVIRSRLLPAVKALGDMPRVSITAEERLRLLQGQSISNRHSETAVELAAIDGAGQLVAIVQPQGGQFCPSRCFGAES
jgi:tRNA pseudouridine55 synthase